MSDAAPALRRGIVPRAALAVEVHPGPPRPFLGPAFAALLPIGGPRRPPVLQLARLFALLVSVSVGPGRIVGSLSDSPASVRRPVPG